VYYDANLAYVPEIASGRDERSGSSGVGEFGGGAGGKHAEDVMRIFVDFWYPAMRSEEIYGRICEAMLLDVPLVLDERPKGKAFCRCGTLCPDRGIPPFLRAF